MDNTTWRRFTCLTDDEQQIAALNKLLARKKITRDDLLLILQTVKLNHDNI